MEAGFWRAAGDGNFYRKNFAENGICVFGFGVLDKQQTVASIESSPPWTSVEMQDVTTIAISSDVVALAYRAHAARNDDLYEATVSSVYVNRDGRWQLALHQQTPVG